MAKRKVSIPCAGRDRKGQPCGRYCPPGKQFCSVHDPDAKPTGIAAQHATDDPLEIVKRLMKSRDEGTRLRAADLYMKLLERDAAKPASSSESDHLDVKRLTEDEREGFRVLFEAFEALERRVWLRCPDAVRGGHVERFERERRFEEKARDEERRLAAEQAKAARWAEAEHASAVPLDAAPAGAPDFDAPFEVTPVYAAQVDGALVVTPDGKAVGLYIANKIVTHARGDEYAERVLSGDISFTDAKAAQDAADAAARRLAVALLGSL